MAKQVPEVKRLRLRLGLTQEEFAHRLGATVSTVNRWESGKLPSRLAQMAMAHLQCKEQADERALSRYLRRA